jgi:hypothetical protein
MSAVTADFIVASTHFRGGVRVGANKSGIRAENCVGTAPCGILIRVKLLHKGWCFE